MAQAQSRVETEENAPIVPVTGEQSAHERFGDPKNFINRELSWLEFNRRVLEEAQDPTQPLIERVKFLYIFSSNLDEFFEIRVAGIKQQIESETSDVAADGLSPTETFNQIQRLAHELVATEYELWNTELLPQLAKNGIRVRNVSELNAKRAAWARKYFQEEVFPMLTPLAVDASHPFPDLLNKSHNLLVRAKAQRGGEPLLAIVQVPRVVPRLILTPRGKGEDEPWEYIYLASLIKQHIAELFPGLILDAVHAFRVTRNSDLYIDEEELRELNSLRKALQGELSQRQFGDGVRLEVADLCSPRMIEALLQQFNLTPEDLYQVNGPVNMVRLIQVLDTVDRPDLKFPAFVPGLPRELIRYPDIFDAIRRGDVLLHHPYQSFIPVINFIERAAHDPQVVAIRQTVYRTGAQSKMMELLIAAARNGKAVTVVVELMARFDEEANINWAQRLEEAGAHVIYGVVGHKTHAKMALVVRREDDRLRRYVHLGTGNYHSRTATLYTDFGLFTCNEEICSDVSEVFMQLTGLGKAMKLRHLWQSPFTLHQRSLKAIQAETRNARAGHKARIIAKMNALLEPEIIAALYEASQAGVKIDLIVRGVCALRPGISGISDNIRVISVLGRFLEHTRVFFFHNGGAKDVYLSSADWMDRNFFRRIEICFPVLDSRLKQRVLREGLEPFLGRAVEAWDMDANGHYIRRKGSRGKRVRPQTQLLEKLANKRAS